MTFPKKTSDPSKMEDSIFAHLLSLFAVVMIIVRNAHI